MTGEAAGIDAAEPHAGRALEWVRAVGGRVLSFCLTLSGAVALVQVLLALAPGDAIDVLPDGDVLREGLEREWGLDQPLPTRIALSLRHFAAGDLGTSLTYRPGAAVRDLVVTAGMQSLGLLVPALILGLVLAIGLGAWTAGDRPEARFVRQAVHAVSILPGFLAAYLAVVGTNAAVWAMLEKGWIERPDWFALPDTDSPVRTALAIVLLAVASGGLTEMHAACEGELRRLRRAPFIDAARAQGAPVWPRLLHNLLPTVATIASSRAAALLGGVVVIEKVLLRPGAGAMLWQACRLRDYPLAVGITFSLAGVVCAARLAGDLVRIALDPRLRSAA